MLIFKRQLAKILGVAPLAWLAFAVLRPGSDARKSRRQIRALRRNFVDQLSARPHLNEHEFESVVYHHISRLSNSQDALARRWLLRWGVVLLNCSHVVAIARLGKPFRSADPGAGSLHCIAE